MKSGIGPQSDWVTHKTFCIQSFMVSLKMYIMWKSRAFVV